MSVNSVDSDQYVDGSIDNAHLANDAVGTDELANDVVISTSGAITTTNNSGFTANSGSHGYVTINASATGTASWLSHTKAGSGKWLAGVEGGETDYQLYNTGGSNATRLRVAQAGDVTVTTGDLVFGTAGKGVVLGATSNVDANTLDDYEEGTWTPGLASGAGSFSKSLYTKIGNLVNVSTYCSHTTDGSGGTGITVNNLPYSCTASEGIGTLWTTGIEYDTGSTACVCQIQSNSSNCIFANFGADAGGSHMNAGYWDAGSTFFLSITYRTA